jgi:endogenous inhibitor of DNA gyrase (YacG/DUF329 family)
VTGNRVVPPGADSRNAFACSTCGLPIVAVAYFQTGYPHDPECEGCFRATTFEAAGGIYGYAAPGDVRLPRTRTCATCGREVAFGGPSRSRLLEAFCSWECRRDRDRQRRRVHHAERDCESCGEPFAPTRTDARFCLARCRQRAYRKRKGA